MAKVYIVNKGCHDHSDARRFGDLIYLSDGPINRHATSNMFRSFYPRLSESESTDYILITGLGVMNSIACSIFASIHGRINILLYKSTRKECERAGYIERTIIIREEEEDE